MKILVTGANGFIGKNLISELNNKGLSDIFKFNRDTDSNLLDEYASKCDFVFHLAGVNRPKSEEDFYKGNVELTEKLLLALESNDKKPPIVITSSIQAGMDNPYGRSKKLGEDLVKTYCNKNHSSAYIYRMPNMFGKWSKPNYNSVVSTFCYNISRNIDIEIHDESKKLILCYIDDLILEFISLLKKNHSFECTTRNVNKTYEVTLRELADKIFEFKKSRENLYIPNMGDGFTKKLYSTYLSYLPNDEFSYDLKMNVDERGSFTEILKTKSSGQVSVNVSKPGVTKGNHWHHTKNEKFLVVSGKALVRFRKIDSDEIIEYVISGEKHQVVDIPVGYTHSIINIGDDDLVTVMWVNENFDPENPDTYYLEV